jgi:hypothetical protein
MLARTLPKAFGAVAISVSIWWFAIQPGIAALGNTPSPISSTAGFIVVSVEGPATYSEVTVKTNDLSVDSRKRASFYIEVEAGVAGSVARPGSFPIDQTDLSGSPSGGFSILFTGDLADSVSGCVDSDFRPSTPVWADLTATEKRAVVNYLQGEKPNAAAESAIDGSGDPGQSAAWIAAAGMHFKRFRPSVMFGSDGVSTYNHGGISESYVSLFNLTTCLAGADYFWRDQSVARVLNYPGVAVALQGTQDTTNHLSAVRDLWIEDDPYVQSQALQSSGNRENSGLLPIATSTDNSGQLPFTRIDPVGFSFDDLKAAQSRNYRLVLAGIGISVVAALTVGLLKTLTIALIGRVNSPR